MMKRLYPPRTARAFPPRRVHLNRAAPSRARGRQWRVGALASLTAILAACGGSGGSGATPSPEAAVTAQSLYDRGEIPARVETEETFFTPGGTLTNYLKTGGLNTAEHAFFSRQLGTNGRACVTCHVPSNGMGLSTDNIRSRYIATKGTDPLFARIDGANCPTASRSADKKAPDDLDDADNPHSLLLRHGLFRIALPWPPKDASGNAISPEFTIEVASDPTGCNTDPLWGLRSAAPRISVYRKSLPATNQRFIVGVTSQFGPPFDVISMLPFPINPDTGRVNSGNIMADGREATLETQARTAVLGHAQGTQAPTARQLQQIVDFQTNMFTAMSSDSAAGNLTDNGATGGPRNVEKQKDSVIETTGQVFLEFDSWKDDPSEARRSVYRGAKLFNDKLVNIRDVAGISDSPVVIQAFNGGNNLMASCANCHDTKGTGSESFANALRDIGTSGVHPAAIPMPDLPTFKLTCHSGKSTPFFGNVVFTHDPGMALVTGKCADIQRTKVLQLRGLSARAPYFVNGSAKTLKDVVDLYNRRFDMKLSPRDVDDLVAFMKTL